MLRLHRLVVLDSTPTPQPTYSQTDFNANVIRLVTRPGGLATTIAGTVNSCAFADGPGPSAKFCQPTGIAVDRAGTFALVVSDNAPGAAL